MSAARLREAAVLMRERAEAATGGPWEHVRVPFRDTASHSIKRGDQVLALVGWEREDADRSVADAAHIASWHPAVALAVADWLGTTADHADATGGHCVCDDAALAVANAYLGDPT